MWTELILIVPVSKLGEAEEVAKLYDPNNYVFTQPLNDSGDPAKGPTHYGCQATMTEEQQKDLLKGLKGIQGLHAANPKTRKWAQVLEQLNLKPLRDAKFFHNGPRKANDPFLNIGRGKKATERPVEVVEAKETKGE